MQTTLYPLRWPALAGLLMGAISLWCLGLAHGASIEGIEMRPDANGVLNIYVGVNGNARSLNPSESVRDGVYRLQLSGGTGAALESNPLIMDANGQYIGRLSHENGGTTLVIPGVASSQVRVHLNENAAASKSVQSGKLSLSSQEKAKAPIQTPSRVKPGDGLQHLPPAFELAPPAQKLELAQASPAPKAKQVEAKNAERPRVSAKALKQVTISTSDNEVKNNKSEIKPTHKKISTSWQALSIEEAYRRYVELPWQNSDWLQARNAYVVASSQARAAGEASGYWWWLSFALKGVGLLALGIVLLKSRGNVFRRYQHWVAERSQNAQALQNTQPIENTMPAEKPFAAWLVEEGHLDEATTHEASPNTSDSIELSAPIAAVAAKQTKDKNPIAENKANDSELDMLFKPFDELVEAQAQREVEVQQLHKAEKARPVPERRAKAGLKAPSFYAYQHKHRALVEVLTENDARALFNARAKITRIALEEAPTLKNETSRQNREKTFQRFSRIRLA